MISPSGPKISTGTGSAGLNVPSLLFLGLTVMRCPCSSATRKTSTSVSDEMSPLNTSLAAKLKGVAEANVSFGSNSAVDNSQRVSSNSAIKRRVDRGPRFAARPFNLCRFIRRPPWDIQEHRLLDSVAPDQGMILALIAGGVKQRCTLSARCLGVATDGQRSVAASVQPAVNGGPKIACGGNRPGMAVPCEFARTQEWDKGNVSVPK